MAHNRYILLQRVPIQGFTIARAEPQQADLSNH